MKRFGLTPGDRIRLSALGRRNSRKVDRRGVVTGVLKTGTRCSVRWDGLTRDQTVHITLLELDVPHGVAQGLPAKNTNSTDSYP